MALSSNPVKLCVVGFEIYPNTEIGISMAGCSEASSPPPVNILSHLNALGPNSWDGCVMRCEHRPILKVDPVHDSGLTPLRSELIVQSSDKISERTPSSGRLASGADFVPDEKANDASEQIAENRAYHFVVPAL